MKIRLESGPIMKDKFNDTSGSRPHHYILRLSRTAGSDRLENPGDRDKPPFQQAILFVQRLKKWAEAKGLTSGLTTEILPVAEDGHPRLRVACTPAVMTEIQTLFPRKIRQVDEIPLPEPSKRKKSIWKLIFGG
jgi:hypothetical protein